MLRLVVRMDPEASKNLIGFNPNSERGEVEAAEDNVKDEGDETFGPEKRDPTTTAQASQVVQRLLGQKESRLEWDNPRDLGLTRRQVAQIKVLVHRMSQRRTLPSVVRDGDDMANAPSAKRRR